MIRTNLKAIKIIAAVLLGLVIILLIAVELFTNKMDRQAAQQFEPALAPSSVIFPDAFELSKTDDGVEYQLLTSGRFILTDPSTGHSYVLTPEGKIFLSNKDGSLEETDEETQKHVLDLAKPIIDDDDTLSTIFSGIGDNQEEDLSFVVTPDGSVVALDENGNPQYVILPDGTVMAMNEDGSFSPLDADEASKIFSQALAAVGNEMPEFITAPDGTVIQLDENGNPVHVIGPDGSVYAVDENGNLHLLNPEDAEKIISDAVESMGEEYPFEYQEDEGLVPRPEILSSGSSYSGEGNAITANIGGLGSTGTRQQTQTSSTPTYSTYDPTASTAAIAEAALASQMTQTAWESQNNQQGKRDFMSQFSENTGLEFLTTNDLAAGTVISMTLLTGLNSDLPGQIIAQVDQNVYDTLTGKVLLVPKGTKLIATYDSSVSWGQKRALVAWTQLVRPDGLVVRLPGLPGIDAQGYSGYQDKVNNHIWSLIGGAALASIIDLAADEVLIQADDAGIESSGLNALGSFTGTLQSAGQKWLSKVIERQPTLTIRPGRQISLLVTDTLTLTPYRR